MNEQGRKNLEELADFLSKLPEERFDYSSWVGAGWQGKPDLSCGTTACALGWAMQLPFAKEIGAFLYQHRGMVEFHGPEGHVSAGKIAETLFDLELWEHDHLFYPDDSESGMTAKDVAKKIRNFLEKGLPDAL